MDTKVTVGVAKSYPYGILISTNNERKQNGSRFYCSVCTPVG
jgi:hypothetical protein